MGAFLIGFIVGVLVAFVGLGWVIYKILSGMRW
jgi:hypothetical protein